jgi:hypothetical protein
MSKKIFPVLCCILLLAFVFTACSKTEEPVQYDSLSELSNAVGFDVVNPQSMPDGYALIGYYAVGGNLAQIAYVNGDKELIFAMTTLKKVECETGEFDQTETKDVNGIDFEYSMVGGSVVLAVARAGAYTYAIYARNGLTEEEMAQAAQGLGLS